MGRKEENRQLRQHLELERESNGMPEDETVNLEEFNLNFGDSLPNSSIMRTPPVETVTGPASYRTDDESNNEVYRAPSLDPEGHFHSNYPPAGQQSSSPQYEYDDQPYPSGRYPEGETRLTSQFWWSIMTSLMFILIVLSVIFLALIVISWNRESEINASSYEQVTWTPSNYAIGSFGMVASDHPTCSMMGRDVLQQLNGNAYDAAVTVALCLGVVNPMSSGLGGGAAILIRDASGETALIDGRETAPAAATRDMFVEDNSAARTGPLASGVPGELKALWTMWNTYGVVPWSDLVMPVSDLAKSFLVGPMLAQHLESKKNSILSNDPFREVFSRNGEVLREGQECNWDTLSQTLAEIATDPDSFYSGRIAKNLVQDNRDLGGILTEADFEGYTIKPREVLSTFYFGHEVILASPPFTGGAVVGMALNILEGFSERYRTAQEWADHDHLMVEAMKFSYADRSNLGDPDFVSEALELAKRMAESKVYAGTKRSKIDITRTFGVGYYEGYYELDDGNDTLRHIVDQPLSTSHFSIVDRDRSAVSLTTTINLLFGSFVMSPSTGIIMNSEMDDFSIPGVPNAFGYPPNENNFVAPGKRPASSMTPAIVTKNGEFHLALGASGGSRIPTAVLQGIENVVRRGDVIDVAISRGRLHHQLVPNYVVAEYQVPNFVLNSLYERKHEIQRLESGAYNSVCNGIQQIGRLLEGASDYRKKGNSSGY